MPLPNTGMTFTPFDPLPASDLNDLVENIEALADGSGLNIGAVTPAKMLGIDLLGRTSGIVGSPPAAGTGQFYIQAGSDVGTFAGSALDIPFPTAFPNGVISVTVCDGDNVSGEGKSLNNGNVSTTGFRVQSPTNGSKRINWIAIGF